MADNITIPAQGIGTTTPVVATDDISGVHYQMMKLVDGTADSIERIGGTAANGLDVDVTRVQGVVSVDDNGASLSIDDGGNTITVDGTVNAVQSGTWNITTLGTITNVVHVDDNGSTLSIDDGGGTISVDGTVTANAGTGTFTTKESRSSSPSQSTVAASASNVTLLTSNSNRLGATIYNDSSSVLYLKLGATASTSSFTIKMQPESYYEIPFFYTGIVDGIWASATGNARITELS